MIRSHLKRGLRTALPQVLQPAAKAQLRTIKQFAERAGLVYFGFVSQRNDEHHLIRGLTVSVNHADNHYCIGSVNEYDVMFVERTDTINKKHHSWHILQIDLHTKRDIPHALIVSAKNEQALRGLIETKYPLLAPMRLGATALYPDDFTLAYRLITNPANVVEVEQWIRPETAALIATHFRGFEVELANNSLYVYSDKTRLNGKLLDTLLTNSIWLARVLDSAQ